jgi:hypothetical protein
MLVLLSASLVLGCGGTYRPPSYGSEEGRNIALFMEEFNEAISDARRFQNSFADKPTQPMKVYSQFMYDVVGSPSIQGDQATAKIQIRTEGGQDKGSLEWTFVKQGDKWKIKNAPLP